ncbi:MAG: hypothetical protein A2Z77_00550 [Chloroflexi bacterium RBG_13_51_36]|nr:MAG: hypothetical protein A2Z77_00550 [Chloroflexi bacterium RBG_13_51_36]
MKWIGAVVGLSLISTGFGCLWACVWVLTHLVSNPAGLPGYLMLGALGAWLFLITLCCCLTGAIIAMERFIK